VELSGRQFGHSGFISQHGLLVFLGNVSGLPELD
jgi:hypothetical protein